jgi:ABC-2 type transport system permease protein
MNRNLFLKELKRNRKNLFIWTGVVLAFTLMVLASFPTIKSMGGEIQKMMESFPEEMQDSMGMSAKAMSDLLGFYSIYLGVYIVMFTGIYAMSAGANIISKEEKDRTAEFLLTRPLDRKEIFFTKMGALAVLVFAILLIQTAFAGIGMAILNEPDFSWSTFATMQIHSVGLVIFFAGAGVFISMLAPAKMNFMGPVVGAVFGTYLIDTISKAAEPINWLGYISPFHYAEFDPFAEGFGLKIVYMILFVALAIAGVVFAYKKFDQKDIGA